VLPSVFLNDVRKQYPNDSLLDALSNLCEEGEKAHPDVRRAWRFIFHVDNLAALYRGPRPWAAWSMRCSPCARRIQDPLETVTTR